MISSGRSYSEFEIIKRFFVDAEGKLIEINKGYQHFDVD